MGWDPSYKPRLRPVEAFRVPVEHGDHDGELVGIRDSGGLSNVVLTMSIPALQVLSFMDGSRSCDEVLEAYHRLHNQPLKRETLESMLDHLEEAHFLEGPTFEAHYASLVAAYQQAPARDMPHAGALGVDASGRVFDEMLADFQIPEIDGEIAGVIAPHLDYGRGAPCYALVYGLLGRRKAPQRVVILGTNHFGRSRSVVATGKDFQTPLGRTPADVDFIERLERRVGPLRACEFDHAREHSVELQVVWLQHLFGADAFAIVPILCPDPCVPAGVPDPEPGGVDLHEFSEALAELMGEDQTDTLVIAGADLSHVGMTFGDERRLDDAFLGDVAQRDQSALARLEGEGADAFVHALQDRDNDTRVCSAGCIFVAATVLKKARPQVLKYHQAVDHDTQNCVTCTAVVFT